MIPIRLTIKGLYSYQHEQTIEFTKLTAANLFGIFGPVGSGKSSILEAITFALYGKTDRLNLSGDNRNYNMMNLKSNELLIDFEFETGKNRKACRAVVKGRRNSKRFDDVKKLDRTAYQKENGTWQPLDVAGLEALIGLSYENFKRTIIIPQGQFQEFLQLGNTERTRMMKELFNLERFELFYQTAALETRNNGMKQNLQGQLQQLGDVDPEKMKEYENNLEALKKELTEVEKNLKAAQNDEMQLRHLLQLTQKLEAAKVELETLQKQKMTFVQLEKNINEYEKCVLQFKNLLEALEQSRERKMLMHKKVEAGAGQLEILRKDLKNNELALEKIKPEYEAKETLQLRADELKTLLKIIQLKEKTAKAKIRLENGIQTLKVTVNDAEKLSGQKQQITEKIKQNKAALPDLNQLSTIRAWHVEKQSLEKQETEVRVELNKNLQKQADIEHAVEMRLKHADFSGLPADCNFAEILHFAQLQLDALKTEIKKLEHEARHLQVKIQLEKFAGELVEGSPCPLCGAINHPEIYSAENIRDDQKQQDSRKQELEQKTESWWETISELNELNSQRKFRKEALGDWTEKLNQNAEKTRQHLATFKWPDYDEPEKVERAFEAAKALQSKIQSDEDLLENLVTKLEKAQQNKERYQAAIDEIKTEITVHESSVKTLEHQLKLIAVDEYAQSTAAEIEREISQLLERYGNLEKRYRQIADNLLELRKNCDTLAGILTANREALATETKNELVVQTQVQAQLANSRYTAVDEVQQILSQALDVEQEKLKISTFKQNSALAASRFAALQQEIGERVYDEKQHEQLREEIVAMAERQSLINRESGKTEVLLKKLRLEEKQRVQLQKSLEQLEQRAENIKTLKSLFKASGFVNYISSVYLQNLCNAANDRFFKLTRQKLSLEITPDNNFEVRDFMNGGKTRSVKTLSGGQTFQAALSLALALADNIQKITESNQNFFFLDEGFGSLDREALAVVFDTLKSLQKENRIVGVISHVEEMQHEIDVHLRIEHHEEQGSCIRESWKS